MQNRGHNFLRIQLVRRSRFEKLLILKKPKSIISRRHTTEDQNNDDLNLTIIPKDNIVLNRENPQVITYRRKTTECSFAAGLIDSQRNDQHKSEPHIQPRLKESLPLLPILKKIENRPFAIKGRPKSVTFKPAASVLKISDIPKTKRPIPQLLPIQSKQPFKPSSATEIILNILNELPTNSKNHLNDENQIANDEHFGELRWSDEDLDGQ